MRQKAIFLFFLFLLNVSSFAQKKSDDVYLTREIDDFLHARDPGDNSAHDNERKSEVQFLMMQVDSSGKISSVHIFSDETERNITFSILKQLKPQDLNKLTFSKWRSKLIVLPVVTISENPILNYADSFKIGPFKIYEEHQTVILSPFYWWIPRYQDAKGFPNRTNGIYVDSLPAKKVKPY